MISFKNKKILITGATGGIGYSLVKKFNELDYPAKPRWQLDESALFLKGSGVKL